MNLPHDLIAVLNVIIIDVVLAGDNAIIVGIAASRVDPAIRSKVIFCGIGGAVVLRVLMATIATQLLTIIGLTLAGGILLLGVCWKMYRQLVGAVHVDGTRDTPPLNFRQAVTQVILADVTMSVDNVLAVAGAAKGSLLVLTLGLGVAIVLMALASHFIARLLSRFPWVTWVGLAIVVYVALSMIWDGWHQIGRAYPPLSLEALGSVWRGQSR